MCFLYFSTGRYFPLAPYSCALILLQTDLYALYDTRGMCSCSLSITISSWRDNYTDVRRAGPGMRNGMTYSTHDSTVAVPKYHHYQTPRLQYEQYRNGTQWQSIVVVVDSLS